MKGKTNRTVWKLSETMTDRCPKKGSTPTACEALLSLLSFR